MGNEQMWHVGRTGADLAGGIWLFGLGADPKATESWELMMASVRASGDKVQEIEIAKHKPTQRGYWMQIQNPKEGTEKSAKRDFGRYLARQIKTAKVQ